MTKSNHNYWTHWPMNVKEHWILNFAVIASDVWSIGNETQDQLYVFDAMS